MSCLMCEVFGGCTGYSMRIGNTCVGRHRPKHSDRIRVLLILKNRLLVFELLVLLAILFPMPRAHPYDSAMPTHSQIGIKYGVCGGGGGQNPSTRKYGCNSELNALYSRGAQKF